MGWLKEFWDNRQKRAQLVGSVLFICILLSTPLTMHYEELLFGAPVLSSTGLALFLGYLLVAASTLSFLKESKFVFEKIIYGILLLFCFIGIGSIVGKWI